ncbi:MAG TPA: Ig-like domain repeat protein, partial [Devosia sp.]|nr:Ig-like domain repeat protein [Devosia sp.]
MTDSDSNLLRAHFRAVDGHAAAPKDAQEKPFARQMEEVFHHMRARLARIAHAATFAASARRCMQSAVMRLCILFLITSIGVLYSGPAQAATSDGCDAVNAGDFSFTTSTPINMIVPHGFYQNETINIDLSGGNNMFAVLSDQSSGLVIAGGTVYSADPLYSFKVPETNAFNVEYNINSVNTFPMTVATTCTAAPLPTIGTVSPNVGPAAGSTAVTITGTGFTSDAAVALDGAPATSVTFVSPTQLIATMPAHAVGLVAVTVILPSGTSAPGQFTYEKNVTTLALATSSATSTLGEPLVFTATLAGGASPTGAVRFMDGTDLLGTVTIAGNTATFDATALPVGTHSITAIYDGDANNAPATSAPLTQGVRALGSVIIRQQTDGADAVFGFSSPTSALNLSIPTSGGRGESAAISLPAGSYAITADDMTGAGFSLTGLACSDADSTTDLASGTASIALDAGEALVCTFTSANSREKTTQLIEEFLTTRASLILANQPDIERRIDRLNGIAPSGGNPVSALMGYLPGIVEGSPLTVSTSLGAIERLAGNEQPSRFDVWFEGTFALFDRNGPNGNFNTASLGADYLVTSDLLIGGFVQMDRLSQSASADPATISGTGWLAGPYATARLNENLYFD